MKQNILKDCPSRIFTACRSNLDNCWGTYSCEKPVCVDLNQKKKPGRPRWTEALGATAVADPVFPVEGANLVGHQLVTWLHFIKN